MQPIRWLIGLISLILCAAFLDDTPIYLNIYSRETDQDLVFGNAYEELHVDKRTGEWTSWTDKPVPGNLLTPDQAFPALDFSIDGVHLIAKHGATFLRKTIAIDKDRQGCVLSVTVGVLPQGTGYAYELTSSYRLFPQQKRLERWARLIRNRPGLKEHFDGFRFQLPGAMIGPKSENTVTIPGPFFTTTFVAPDTPYDSLKAKKINFHSAPDAGFGLFMLANKNRKTVLGSWMVTGGEVAYTTAIQGNGQTITCRHDDKRAYYLLPQMAVESDTHCVELAESPTEIMGAYRRMVARTMPRDVATPDWVKSQVILEVYPTYYKGGLKELTARLPVYKKTGFTMIYLMPHWEGGYSPVDLFKVDSRFGSPADLKVLVKTAHSLGLKVIFDMVIHGFSKKSPLIQQRPELFVRNEGGELALHPTWKSVTTDWANPAYQQYMVDVVLHDQREYGNDGYRVDAATFKGAGWNPAVPYPAYRDGSAAPELMRAMLSALRQKNPDAVLLSEVFGPVFYSVCNFAHDNQTEAVPLLLEKMQGGTYTAAEYKRHIEAVYELLPKGANRVFYARNHDTSWFYHFGGYTPRFMAFEAVHAFFGIPEVFAGDPKNRPSPDDEPGVYEAYRKLFALRKQFPELVSGDVELERVNCNNPHVFSGLRSLKGQSVMALISFSDQAQTTTVTLDSSVKVRPGAKLTMLDTQSGQPVALTSVGVNGFTVTLNPFQGVVGRITR
ncbi:MAG: hypothetical protein LH606_17310 [Cytophagaceae bacterium]|nr:hypothetical protein [Cytophagaceae bacterium]